MRSSRYLFAALLALTYLHFYDATSTPASEETAGRLGSTRTEFDDKYGSSRATESQEYPGAAIATYLEANGYSQISVVYYLDAAVMLTLLPETGSSWDLRRATVLADRFFPRDVVLSTEHLIEDRLVEGEVVYQINSDALGQVVGEDSYEDFGLDGESGDAVAFLTLADRDVVTKITLSIGLSDPIDLEVAPVAQAPEQTSNQQPQEQEDQPDVSAAEQAYLIEIVIILDGAADSVRTVGQLSLDAGNDITLIFDEDWVFSVAVELVYWSNARDQVAAISPPPAFTEVHALILGAMDNLVAAAYEYAYGVDNLDADALSRAAQLMQDSTALIELATAELDRIATERGL